MSQNSRKPKRAKSRYAQVQNEQGVPIQDRRIRTRVDLEEGDMISDLPSDTDPIQQYEADIINRLFQKENSSTMMTILRELKPSIIAGILFVLFSLQIQKVDDIIMSILPITSNPSIMLGFKAIMFIVIYWSIMHFSLMRRDA